MSKLGLMMCACLFIAPMASAQIYKCPGKDGTDLYQNFPCDIDSLGSVPSKATGDKPGAQAGSKASPSDAALVTLATAGKTSPTSDVPHIGMSTDEVKAIWGDPASDLHSEIAEGLIEIWSYGGSRSVQFDYKGRVSIVHP